MPTVKYKRKEKKAFLIFFLFVTISIGNLYARGFYAESNEVVTSDTIAYGHGRFVAATSDQTKGLKNDIALCTLLDAVSSSKGAINLDRVWINVFNDTYGLSSTTLIAFSDDFSDAYVNSEDVIRLATPVSIFSKLDSSEELAINARNTYEVEDSFYLGFTTQVQEMQDYRISIQNIDGSNLTNATVYLIDSLLGSVTNLSLTNYTFSSNEAIFGNRFRVVFQQPVLYATWDGSSWSPDSPNNSTTAVIAGDYDSCATMGSINALSLTVQSGSTLTICTGDYLNVEEDIIINGNLVVADEGSIVQKSNTATVTNNGSIRVEKITPTMAAQSFMISGSPMTGETREGVFGSAYIVRNHLTANFVPNVDVEVVSPGVNNWADDNGNNWVTQTGGLNPGEGYMVFPQPDGITGGSFTQNHTLGTLTNGVVDFTMGFNGTQNASPSILSNPYASAIDAELFFDDPANSDIDVVYFWEHNTPLSTTYPGYKAANFSMTDISYYQEGVGGTPAASGGATPTNIVSSGQGFGVKPTAAGTARFNNAMRVTGPNDSYRTSSDPIVRDRLWVNVYNETYGLGSTTLIAFTENTSDVFVNSEDVKRIATPVSLYSELDSEEQLGINALGAFETSDAVTLGFSTQVKETQSYRISIHDLDGVNMEAATVYLIDALTGTATNLSEGDYTFQSGEATYSKRFKVVFEYGALGANDSKVDYVSLYPNPTQDIITIVAPQTIVTSATVYDLGGRKVSEVDFRNKSSYQVDLSAMEIAVYFIEITTEDGTVMKRVMKR